jgi:hypothetical protein
VSWKIDNTEKKRKEVSWKIDNRKEMKGGELEDRQDRKEMKGGELEDSQDSKETKGGRVSRQQRNKRRQAHTVLVDLGLTRTLSNESQEVWVHRPDFLALSLCSSLRYA